MVSRVVFSATNTLPSLVGAFIETKFASTEKSVEVLVKIAGSYGGHLAAKLSIRICICRAVSPLQQSKVILSHARNLSAKHEDPCGKSNQDSCYILVNHIAFRSQSLYLHPFVVIDKQIFKSMIAA